jgi:hypothetical protein
VSLRVTGLRGTSGGDGVLGIALAAAAAALTVGTIDLNDTHSLGEEVSGQSSAIAAGALDAGELDLAEAAQPVEQCRVAGSRRLKGRHVEQRTVRVEGGSDVDVEVGVDTGGDPRCQGGHCHPFVGKRGGCRVTARTKPTDRYQDSLR